MNRDPFRQSQNHVARRGGFLPEMLGPGRPESGIGNQERCFARDGRSGRKRFLGFLVTPLPPVEVKRVRKLLISSELGRVRCSQVVRKL